ncbi:uncharacterized protein PG998_015027 [Apiospora kogelbergensis]|uniref:uncharacterized protein n=1 Tax=Apiospora kogelbergensis TaxID=1337665 RepID=UPI00312EB355
MASDNESTDTEALKIDLTITGKKMDVLDRLWDIFEIVEIDWATFGLICGFNKGKDAKDHYDDIGKTKPSKFHITRRDIKTVVDLEPILRSVKIDWKRVSLRSGLMSEAMARVHHHDLVMLERVCGPRTTQGGVKRRWPRDVKKA